MAYQHQAQFLGACRGQVLLEPLRGDASTLNCSSQVHGPSCAAAAELGRTLARLVLLD